MCYVYFLHSIEAREWAKIAQNRTINLQGASHPQSRAFCTVISTSDPKSILSRMASDSINGSRLVTLNETLNLSPASLAQAWLGSVRAAVRPSTFAMKLRVVIADDERLARERLRELLEAEPGIHIVAECATGTETVLAIREERPDLVLLDVRMPEMDAFEVIRTLGNDHLPAIIFVTAHDQFALRAFEANAADYLLKPFDRDRFRKALHRGRERAKRNTQSHSAAEVIKLLAELKKPSKIARRFAIRLGERIFVVKPDEIDWIQGAGNYSELHVGSAVHLLRGTLADLEEQLSPTRFIRISRSLIVNVDRIQEIRAKSHGDYVVVLRDGKTLSATRNHREKLLRWLDGTA